MKTTTTPIIPVTTTFAKVEGKHELHKEAICLFAATGFFWDTDTYFRDEVALAPASTNEIDAAGFLLNSTPNFKWHYSPRAISFEDALQEFTTLFERITAEQVGNRKVILPLSGGLDSRSQAAALYHLQKDVFSYSYQFKGGYAETAISKSLAEVCNFEFKKYEIPKGYLWETIDELAKINNCYSEFTHPRQMAIFDEFDSMGEVFSLGHWGDVLFDRGAPEGTQEVDLPELVVKKVVKKGGMELANALWASWKLEGVFEDYLNRRISDLLQKIEIDNVSAKMRAFKSLYWAPRWTSTNLAIFAQKHPISLPYYDNRMCAFICTIPEEYLADRKLQIAYIKKRSEGLAKVTWQDHKPYNLYDYHKSKTSKNLPFRIVDKLKRETKAVLGSPFIERNWELQFVGKENNAQLKRQLFDGNLSEHISEEIIEQFYTKFLKEDPVYYSHPVSMLLTLALRMKLFEDA